GGKLQGGAWDHLNTSRAWEVVMRGVLSAFYSHPWAWNEMGFGGPAYPRGYMRLQPRPPRREPHEAKEAFGLDTVIVGAGAGGGTLAQRLARKGWRIVVLESGPFWDPDRDWVSDEAGQHKIYWTAPRVIGGEDPVELGKNNSGRGVGGSMIHFAGYAPRFHPSDFETCTRDGVGADWPISYAELKPHYERGERELPVAGQNWP